MRILALDTASGSGSVAIADGENHLVEISLARRETHSRNLMMLIDRALQMVGLELKEIDGFAVTRGPGSFTGLRIGISTIKGLAWVIRKPVVGISSLEALAVQAGPSTRLICSMLDARNKEVFFGRFRMVNGEPETVLEEQTAFPADALKGIDEPCLFIGDGVIRYRRMIEETIGDRAVFAHSFQHDILARTILYLSRFKFIENKDGDALSLIPRYLRKSFAEIKMGV